MPQLPIIIPIIVVGGLVGSLLKSKKKLPRKKILSWSLIAGLFNAVFAYAKLILSNYQPSPLTIAFLSSCNTIVVQVAGNTRPPHNGQTFTI